VSDAPSNGLSPFGGSTYARGDAAPTSGDSDRLQFEIVVPDDVAVSSGSGKLPIVGGRAPEEDDTTPPTLTVPSAVVRDATSRSGAAVHYTVDATDETSEPTVTCTPAAGSTFAIGTTTVTCVATDAAGNATTKSFVVTVRGAAAQLASLRELIMRLPVHAQKQLLPHLKEKCNSMRSLSHALANLARKGDISQAQAAEIRPHVERIADILC
jgi:hypothetical protein